jgi:ferredoxin
MNDQVFRKIAGLTVHIDRTLCIGSGNCVKVAPDLFDLDDETVCVFTPTAESVPRTKVVDACEVCPVQALTVTDETGRQLVP